MGKIAVSFKRSETSANKSTRVIKQTPTCKVARNVRYKRLLMLQRRLDAVINEKNTWEEQNKSLSDSLKAEKLLSASLKKESFHWQRLYHETAITVNSYKVKQFEIAETLSVCLREIDSIYPNMVAFSDSVTSNKIRISQLLNMLPSSDHSCMVKRLQDGEGISDEYKQNGKPTKHKVGPMVKGLQIVTKPKIMIERLMLPQTQNRDQENVDMANIEVGNRLSTISEENEHSENACFRNISVRPRRSKLGTSWRMKRQEKMRKDKERGKVRETPYSDDSSESDDVPVVVGMEPVVHFKDVSQLMKSPSLPKVEAGVRNGEESVTRPPAAHNHPMRTDDPLEGSSWMYTNRYQPSQNDRCSSLYIPDSSDDEDDLIQQQKPPNLSTMNTLLDNQTYNISPINKNIKKNENVDNNVTRDCLIKEPDSTNNDSEELNKTNNSFKDTSESTLKYSSSSSVVSSSRNSPELSTDYGTANNTIEEQLPSQKSIPSVRLSKVLQDTSSSPRRSSLCTSRHSNVYVSPVNEGTGKRVRKPANHRYPGEDYVVSNSKVKQSKMASSSTGKKSLTLTGKVVKGLKKRSLENGSTKSLTTDDHGCDKEAFKPKAANSNNKRKSSKPKLRRLSTNDSTENLATNDDGCDEGASKPNAAKRNNKRKSSKPKLSSSKKSIHTPINSRRSTLSSPGSEDLSRPTRPKRNKSGKVCYKVSPLNSKKRRP